MVWATVLVGVLTRMSLKVACDPDSPKNPLSWVISLSLLSEVGMAGALEKSNLPLELAAVITVVGVPAVENTEFCALTGSLNIRCGQPVLVELV